MFSEKLIIFVLFCMDATCFSEKYVIFAEEKLHSAIWKQVFIALICIIFAEDKLHSAIWKQVFIALACTIFAEN